MQHLLEVRTMSVFRTADARTNPIISDVSFALGPGENLIVLGESGSGKTILTRALTNLFPPGHALTVSGEVVFNNHSLSDLSAEELTLLRRRSVRYIFQEPGRALNPLATIRSQMALASDGSEPDEGGFQEELSRVGIADAATVLRSFPHQLSIGMAQRVMIAMALLPGPALVIADEPTSAVDADRRGMILDLLARHQQKQTMALIVATHDVEVARTLGDRVILMLGGKVVESGPAKTFLSSPLHPYAQELMGASQHITVPHTMPPPALSVKASGAWDTQHAGCAFAGRCQKTQAKCLAQEPRLEDAGNDREVRCFFWK